MIRALILLSLVLLTACGGGKVSGPDDTDEPVHCAPDAPTCQ